MENKCGIYALYCKYDKGYYVGFTMTTFIKRFSYHLVKLEDRNANKLLQLAYDKYSLYSFKIIPLEIINKDKGRDYFKHREKYWTLRFLSEGKKLYNQKIVDKFMDSYSFKHTEEHKKCISEKYKGSGNPMNGKSNKWGNHSEETKKVIREKASKWTLEEYKKIYDDLIEETDELWNKKYKRLREKWGCGEDLLKRLKSGRHWSRNYF